MKDNNWVGKANYEHQDYCWLAHPAWVIEGVNCKYWFENSTTVSDGNDYILAVLTGTGTEQGQFGFEFKLNAGCFLVEPEKLLVILVLFSSNFMN